MVKFPSRIKIRNESETSSLAKDFILQCKNGDRVVLNGNLGAGKTFFIKAALSYVGIINVNSPSFSIVNEYFSDIHFYHFDFYRLKNASELFDIGWQDYLNDDESIIFIEWGNIFPAILPHNRFEINIEVKKESEREFIFEKLG